MVQIINALAEHFFEIGVLIVATGYAINRVLCGWAMMLVVRDEGKKQ